MAAVASDWFLTLGKAIASFWTFVLSPPVYAGPAKIVKGESKDKQENLFFEFGYAEPHPIFYKDSESFACFVFFSPGERCKKVKLYKNILNVVVLYLDIKSG